MSTIKHMHYLIVIGFITTGSYTNAYAADTTPANTHVAQLDTTPLPAEGPFTPDDIQPIIPPTVTTPPTPAITPTSYPTPAATPPAQ